MLLLPLSATNLQESIDNETIEILSLQFPILSIIPRHILTRDAASSCAPCASGDSLRSCPVHTYSHACTFDSDVEVNMNQSG